MDSRIYDTLIIGGGPAGYTAALYCARAGLSALVLESITPGGQMADAGVIENYPGFPDGIDGYELGELMRKNAEKFGAKTVFAEVSSLSLEGEQKTAETSSGLFRGRTVVLATGASPRPLDVPGERELRGAGVSYCATCDGMLFRGKSSVVVGGGNTAAGDALYLARLCSKVFLVHRRNELRASRIYHERLAAAGNIELLLESRVTSITGDGRVEAVQVSGPSGERRVECDAVFVAVGRTPKSDMFSGVELDESGYVLAGEDTKTNIPGVFAAGDVRKKPLRQIVGATSDGSAAAYAIEQFLD